MSALFNTYAAVGALYSFWTFVQLTQDKKLRRELQRELRPLPPMPPLGIALIAGIASLAVLLAMTLCAAIWPLFLLAEMLPDEEETAP